MQYSLCYAFKYIGIYLYLKYKNSETTRPNFDLVTKS